ncbi:MAG: hypothetical protein ACOYME_00805 [Prochlorotrichaceae cyanobacterium]|jgi:hypothetical protein
MQSQDSQNQDIRELLTKISQNVEHLQEELTQSRQEIQEEVKRWDARFFEFSRDSLNRVKNHDRLDLHQAA